MTKDVEIKDDWPQSLIMSMGTLGGQAAGHPGAGSLALGVGPLLVGYLAPRTRAK